MAETRYCSNCRAEVPGRATTCPACDVYAGDVFDGRAPAHVRSKRQRSFFKVIAVIAIVAGAVALVLSRPDLVQRFTPRQLRPAVVETAAPPVRVVRDRPGGARQGAGAKITEPEAILILRRSLATSAQPIKNECVAITSQGFSEGAWNLTAFNHCGSTRLGRWKVDAKSGDVDRR